MSQTRNIDETALFVAARDGNIRRVKELINAGADVNKAMTDGTTPLFIACENGYLNIVERLLAVPGINVNKAMTDGTTPLYVSCDKGYLNIIERLLAVPRIDVNKSNKNNATPLFVACVRNQLNIVKRLLAVPGIDVNKAITDNTTSPLFIACENGYLNIVERLLAVPGINVNKSNKNDATPLFIACQNGNMNIVERLLAVPEIDVNKARKDGATPVFIACQKSHLNIVERLLAIPGIDVNKAMTNGATPLHVACQFGHLNVIERLLAVTGIDVNKVRTNGATPLHVACQFGHLNIVERLLPVPGIDVNKAMTDGATPLFIACQFGYLNIVERLLAIPGIDVNKAITNGATPMHVACQFGHLNIIERLLVVTGIDVNKAMTSGATPLYIACQTGHLNVVERLLAVPGIDSTKAIEAAKQNKFSEEIRKLLLKEKEEVWQGWTRGDVERMNEIFDDSTAPNITLCPICLKTTTRSVGCMHMKHNCRGLQGFYHKRLYDLYNTDNEIHWCTICGRIGGYGNDFTFRHYKLGLSNQDKPGLYGPTMVMDADCATRSGGGGLREKLMRFQRVREMAFKLNKPRYVGKINEKKAKEMLVEAMWDAPLIQNPDINEILETKSWNIPNTSFPPNVASEEPNAPNIPMPPTHLDPIVHPEETAQFQNATMISDKYIIQFRHEGNLHDQEGQQLSRQAFFSFLQSIGVNEAEEGFLKCWQYVPEGNRREGDHHCGISLYPQEVRIALGLAEVPTEGENTEYRRLYELYRRKFNKAVRRGGRRTRKRRQS